MSEPITPRGLKKIAAITLVGIVVVMIFKHFVPYTFDKQAVNIAAAKQHIPILKPLIENDGRFTNIILSQFTGSGGSLCISGDVFTDKDLSDLKRLVDSSSPPTAIVWEVQVLSQSKRDLLKKK
jgi:hypothetical protein